VAADEYVGTSLHYSSTVQRVPGLQELLITCWTARLISILPHGHALICILYITLNYVYLS